MTCNELMGTLNLTHSLTHSLTAERDMLAVPSVRLSVPPMPISFLNERIYIFDSLVDASFYVFEPHRHYKILRGAPSAGR